MRTVPPGQDVLIYDGACGFCRRAAGKLAGALPPGTAAVSFRERGALRRFPGVDATRCEAALQLVRRDGRVFAGLEAVVQALRARWYGPLLLAYYLPVIRGAANVCYRAFARRRFHPTIVRVLASGERLGPSVTAVERRTGARLH